MFFLHAASLALLVFALGTAASIATTKALRDWAINTLDAPADGGSARQQKSVPMYKIGYLWIAGPSAPLSRQAFRA